MKYFVNKNSKNAQYLHHIGNNEQKIVTRDSNTKKWLYYTLNALHKIL